MVQMRSHNTVLLQNKIFLLIEQAKVFRYRFVTDAWLCSYSVRHNVFVGVYRSDVIFTLLDLSPGDAF